MNTQNLSTLKINKLTQAQYDRELAAGNIDEFAMYLTPDVDYMAAFNPTGSGSFSLNRLDGSTVGACSFTEGNGSVASGYASHAGGVGTTASGYGSFAIGVDTNASGYYSFASGCSSNALGTYSYVEGYKNTAYDYQHVSGKYSLWYNPPSSLEAQDYTHADAIFMVGCGNSVVAQNAFRISSGGKCFGSTAFAATGADFAELFEWIDGNQNDDDRRGLFVTLEGDKIRLANAGDDYIGVISGDQAFIGNSASEEWQGKYLTDIFGSKIVQEVEVPDKIDEETGNVIVPAHTAIQYVVNPEYNPDKEYIMRENRKEWGTVGLIGQVVVVDDGTCVVGGYVTPLVGGIGTASDSGYRVMKRIDENHIKVLVK